MADIPGLMGLETPEARAGASSVRASGSSTWRLVGRPPTDGLAGSAVPSSVYEPPKSMAAKGRSFSRRCSEVIRRMVPERERMTRESVVAPPAR